MTSVAVYHLAGCCSGCSHHTWCAQKHHVAPSVCMHVFVMTVLSSQLYYTEHKGLSRDLMTASHLLEAGGFTQSLAVHLLVLVFALFQGYITLSIWFWEQAEWTQYNEKSMKLRTLCSNCHNVVMFPLTALCKCCTHHGKQVSSKG